MEIIMCPVCASELSLEQITSHLDDERAFARLVALSVPMAHLVVQYIGLFTPPSQRLTLRKKVRIIQQLLPDLTRQEITFKGRDWVALSSSWEQAIEQMLAARAAGRLDLPLKSHGYLYAILAGMADKLEASAEAARHTAPTTTTSTVQVRGRAMSIDDALQQVHGDRDPALVKLDAANRNATPMPADVRARLAALRGAAPKPVNVEPPNESTP